MTRLGLVKAAIASIFAKPPPPECEPTEVIAVFGTATFSAR